jgi:hypothetical protein
LISYSQQTIDAPNPVARYVHRARLSRSIDLASKLCPQGGAIADFGCGIGTFLNRFGSIRPDVKLIGYEPFQSPASGFRLVSSMRDVEAVDVLCCFEVLEHLQDDAIASFVSDAKRIARSVLVSFPIIGGLTLPVKEANRYLLRGIKDYSIKELALATLGTPAPRFADRVSHKGFDFRGMEKHLGEHFRTARRLLSPFPALPWWLNSQVFLVLENQ